MSGEAAHQPHHALCGPPDHGDHSGILHVEVGPREGQSISRILHAPRDQLTVHHCRIFVVFSLLWPLFNHHILMDPVREYYYSYVAVLYY